MKRYFTLPLAIIDLPLTSCILRPTPKPFKPEEFEDGSLESIPLNYRIVGVLFGGETIEKYATGFGRTFDSLKENDVAYDYIDTGNGFRFTFYRGSGGVNGGVNLTIGEQKVLELLKKNPNVTLKVLSQDLNIRFK